MIERLRKRARTFAISAFLAWSVIAVTSAVYAFSNREVAVYYRAGLESAHREGRTEDVRALNEAIEDSGIAFALYVFTALVASGNAVSSALGASRLSASAIAHETRRLETDVT